MLGCSGEPKVLVEGNGLVIDGVDDDQSSGNRLAGGDRPHERFGEEEPTVPVAVLALIDSQAGQQDHADGVARESSHEANGRILAEDRAHGKAEIADDGRRTSEDEGAGGIHPLGGDGMTLKPVVEVVVPARESREVVVVGEWLEPQGPSGHSAEVVACRWNSLTSSGTAAAGLSSSARN